MSSKKSNKTNGSHKTNQRAETQAAYFLSLSLENVRCFGAKQSLDLSDGHGRPAQWTILLGNNGVGKTTILQALVAFQSTAGPPNHYSPLGFGWVSSDLEHNLFRGEGPEPPLVLHQASGQARIKIGGAAPGSSPRLWTQVVRAPRLDAVASSCQRGSFSFEPGCLTPFESPNDIFPPTCYAYGAGRRMGSSSLSEPESEDTNATLFSDRAELRNAEEWLLRLDYSASKTSPIQQQQQRRLQQVKDLLIEILPEGEVQQIRFTTPSGAYPTPRVEFKTPYGWVPLRQLGYGFRTLIAWVLDFASRMVERYPDSPDPLAEPAVVLVDEIDLHLHPTWQRKVIRYLTDCFPNTQFIATAHSPLIVQAASGANLRVLRREGDHVAIDNDVQALRGWRVDQVLISDLFGLPSTRPPELDELLARRKALLTKSRLTTADKREIERLEAEIGPLPDGETAEERKRLELIEESLKLLEERQRVPS